MPASISSTSRSGPQSACRKRRAGSWEWSRKELLNSSPFMGKYRPKAGDGAGGGVASSGSARPDVVHRGDDRSALDAGLEVVDIRLAVADDSPSGRAVVGRDACTLACVPEVAPTQEHRPRARRFELANCARSGVDDPDMGEARRISRGVRDLATIG